MRIPKPLLWLIILLLSLANTNGAAAQISLSGQILDEHFVPIPFANIFAYATKDSNLVQGSISDKSGHFRIEDLSIGSYALQISYIGYQTIDTIVDLKSSIDIKKITLKEAVNLLDDVEVVASRKLVVQKIDRLVIDIENSPKAAQGDALEILRVTPGVNVQNDIINMLGKSTVAVMINDKILRLSNEDLSNYLQSIPSENIKSIEVITAPPAKYEATGNSGLINIILKKGTSESWNAAIRMGFIQRKNANGWAGANLNYNKNKVSIATSIFSRKNNYYQDQDDYAYFDDGLWDTQSPFLAKIEGINGRFDMSYQIKKNWSIGTNYTFNQTEYDVNDSPNTIVTDYQSNETLRSLQSVSSMLIQPTLNAINLNNSINLDSIGKKVVLNLDYFNYDNPDVKEYQGISSINDPFSEQYYKGTNTNNQNVTNLSASLDFEVPTDKINIDFGGKVSWSKSTNDILFFNSGLLDKPVSDISITKNDFIYIENLQALYVSINKKLKGNWEIQLGTRMELNQTESSSINLNFHDKKEYIEFFPTFYLANTLSENNTITFNFSRRINRPQFFDLNPNIYFINPFQTIEGNPFLVPSISNNSEFSHQFKNLTSKLYVSFEDKLFAQVPLPNASSNVIRFTNENYIQTRRYGITEYLSFDKLSWWVSDNSANLNYSISKFFLEELHDEKKGFNFQISTSNDFTLNLKSTNKLLFNLSYRYTAPGINGIFDTKWSGNFAASVQLLAMENNLRISLRANDIFKTDAERISATINDVFQEAIYYYDSQSINLSISYRFGNQSVFAKRNNPGNTDERNRVGG